MNEKIGIIGLGRLGNNLAKYFPAEIQLFVCDKEDSVAINCAAEYHRVYKELDDIIEKLDYIFVCVPPTEVPKLLEKYAGRFKKNAIIMNMATSVDSQVLMKMFEAYHLNIVPLKPIAEGYALSIGLRGIFLTVEKDTPYYEELSYLFQNMGEIRTGIEMEVQQINEVATASAIKLYNDLATELARFHITEEGIVAAIKSVAVGTILDYPPKKDNYYIEQIKKKYAIS